MREPRQGDRDRAERKQSDVTIDHRDWLIVTAASCMFIVAAWAAGLTLPWITPDTAGYLDVAPYPDFFFAQRLPFYGWLVATLGGERGYAPAIWLHLVLHTASASLCYVAVRRLGAGRAAAVSLFLAALLSQGFLIFGRGVIPEAPAMSLMLIALSASLLAVASDRWTSCVIAGGAAGAMAIMLRPILLPLIVIAPVLYAVAGRITARRTSLVRGLMLLAVMILPLLAYATGRARHTGDFKLVAYGGFQMSAAAALMLSPAIVQRFPPADRDFAAQILAVRERAESDGSVSRTPLNSKGERSFVSAAAGYFDIYARTYDAMLGAILSLRASGETWTNFDSRLERFALTTFQVAPEHYAAWIAGATARLVGRMTVTNAPFLLSSLGLLMALSCLMLRPDAVRNLTGSQDTLAVIAVVAAHVLATAPLAVLLTFPASRYIDSAAVLLPALPLYGALRIVAALRSSTL